MQRTARDSPGPGGPARDPPCARIVGRGPPPTLPGSTSRTGPSRPERHRPAVRSIGVTGGGSMSVLPRPWSAVDGGHVRFVVALAGGRGQVAQPFELVVAQFDA